MKYLPWRSSRASPAHSRKSAAYTLMQSPFQLAEPCHLPQLMGVRRRTRQAEWHILLMKPCSSEKSSNPAGVTQGERPRMGPGSSGSGLPTVPHSRHCRTDDSHLGLESEEGTGGERASMELQSQRGHVPLPSFEGPGPCAVQLHPLHPRAWWQRPYQASAQGGRIALSSQAALTMPPSTQLGRRSARVSQSGYCPPYSREGL